jgi:FtsP/CotA-like multicopper oxidase with cupredoxin domain
MRSRRNFLLTLAGLGAGAAATGVAAKLTARHGVALAGDSGVRTIHLEARETTWELAPGKTMRAMAYNGQIPGPEIRAREGERLRIVLKNSLAEPTTIHWHGVDVPNAMDGVPGVTQKPVQPGETFVYEFEARPAGTRWYHTHFQEHRQMDLGLVGPLIIEPATPEPLAYDREATLVLDDWATGAGPVLPSTADGTAGGRGRPGGMMSGMMRGQRMGGMMGGGSTGGMMQGMRRGAHEPAYDTMTINGKAYPATEPLRVRRGERLRLRIVNASAEHTHVVRLAGHRLTVTHTDGNALATPVEVDALPIAPSERYDVVVTADHPGSWSLSCLQPGHASAGERMAVRYDGHERAEPVLPGTDLAGLRLWEYRLGRGRNVLPSPSGSTRTFTLTLSGGMMRSDDAWTINGKIYPQTEPLRLARGDLARIFRNMSPEAHPMHLHGQSFRLVALNGVQHAEPIVKDVVDVEAHMGSAVIEFTAHNPGDWFLHCHKPMHMEGGMIVLARIG